MKWEVGRRKAGALLSVVLVASLLAGCAEQAPPASVPAPPPASAKPPGQEQVDKLVAEMERLSNRVEAEDLDDAATAQVLSEMSAVLTAYFSAPDNVRKHPRLQGALERMCDEALQVELDQNAAPETPDQEETSPRDELLGVTTFISPDELKSTYDAVKKALATSNPGFEITTNDAVLTYVNLFQNKLRNWYTRALTRGQPYVAKMKEIFKDEGVPPSLVYLAIVESAFNPQASSRAKAVGMWQFMQGTGVRYGLTVDFWEDQRKDPELAARAAARYLKDLHGMFGDWQLALAAYNTGEGRIQRYVNKRPEDDFWDMRSNRKALHRETREYVPAILAAILLASNPKAYGIEPPPDVPPPAVASVTIDRATDLRVLAKSAGVSLEEIQEMNPSLRRIMTPPRKYELKIPAGNLEGFQAKLEAVPESERVAVAMHTVAKGETLGSIAKSYHVSAEAIRLANRLPNKRVSPGMNIVVPLGVAASDPVLYAEEGRGSRSAAKVYKVHKGDTLATVSRRTGVPVDRLKEINHLTSNELRPGQRLVLEAAPAPVVQAQAAPKGARTPAPQARGEQRVYHIKAGDTLWEIARHYGITLDQLCRANRISPSHQFHPGDTLIIP
jgi:membrane-bound lytic murein transglycosylase D